MMGSLIVGMIVTLLGTMCIAAGVAISVVEAFRPPEDPNAVGAFPTIKDLTKFLKVVTELMKQFGKLKPAAQLLATGLALFGVGIWLLTARPF